MAKHRVGLRVLVVDDHLDCRESLAELVSLMAAGSVSQVETTCNTGAEGLLDNGWDLVIIDPSPSGPLTPKHIVDSRLARLRRNPFILTGTRPTNEPAALGFILKGECAMSVLVPIFERLCTKAA